MKLPLKKALFQIVFSGLALTFLIVFGLIHSASANTVSCEDLFDIKGAPARTPVTDRTTPPDDFRLVVWRYNSGLHDQDGHSTFSNAKFATLNFEPHSKSYYLRETDQMVDNELVESPENVHHRFDGGGFYIRPDVISSEVASGSQGDGIFDRNQSFTFDTYEKYGYLSSDESRIQKEIARKRLRPEQITFIEGLENRNADSLREEFGEIPRNARLEPKEEAWQSSQRVFMGFDESPNRTYELKVGAAWIIAGQADGQSLPLALESEALVNPIDRHKYKFVFELGRASQVYTFAHDEALKAALFFAVNEVLAAGGRLDEAYVFAHAMDSRRAALFRRKHRLNEFSRYQDPARADEVVVMTSLLDMLKLYRIDDFSLSVKKVRSTLAAAATNVQASVNFADGNGRPWRSHDVLLEPLADGPSALAVYEKIFESRLRVKRNLTVSVGDRSESIEVRDFSDLRWVLPKTLGDKIGDAIEYASPPQEGRDNVVRILEAERNHSQNGRHTQLHGIPEKHSTYGRDVFEPLNRFLTKQNAIEIYRTGEETLTNEEILVATYNDYFNYLKAAGVADPLGFLRANEIHFALTGSDYEISLKEISPAARWFILRPSVLLSYGFGMFGHTSEIPQIYWEALSFSADQVAALATKTSVHPHVSSESSAKILKDPRFLAP